MKLRSPNCSFEEYARFCREDLFDLLARDSAKGYVAILDRGKGPEIVACCFWSMHGFDIKDKEDLPGITLPEGSDLVVAARIERLNKEWNESALKHYGRYYRRYRHPILFGDKR